MMKDRYTTPASSPALEYAAILSGLSMGGDFISDNDIMEIRQIHAGRHQDRIIFVSPSVSQAQKASQTR